MKNKNDPISIIRGLIVGKFYHHIEEYGGWAFEFDNGIWMIAQEIEFPEEIEINNVLKASLQNLYDYPNSQDMAKAAMAVRNKGFIVTDVLLLNNSELLIQYENGNQMRLKTDTEIVDWHWAFSGNKSCPYTETLIACYYPGEY